MTQFTLHNDQDFIVLDFNGVLCLCVSTGQAGTVFHRQPTNVEVTPSAPAESWTSTDDQTVEHDEASWVTDNNGNTFLKIVGGRPAKRKKK